VYLCNRLLGDLGVEIPTSHNTRRAVFNSFQKTHEELI
jgi:hypothetical protein